MTLSRVLLFFLILIPLSHLQARELVRVASIDWCPQICNDKDRPGYLVEMLRGLFKDSKYDLQIDILPWSRAIKLVTSGSYDLLLSPAKAEAPNLQYHRDPISQQVHCFWKIKGQALNIKTAEDLNKIRFVIYKDHSLSQTLEPALRNPSNYFELIYDDKFIERAVQLIRSGRARAFVFTDQTTAFELRRKKIEDIEKDICFQKDDLWLGLTPRFTKRSEGLLAFIDANLKNYKTSQDYQDILKKYDIHFSEVVSW